jgi:predicted transcriptional regulator
LQEIVGKAKKVAAQVEELPLNWKLFLSAVFISWQEKELLTKKTVGNKAFFRTTQKGFALLHSWRQIETVLVE